MARHGDPRVPQLLPSAKFAPQTCLTELIARADLIATLERARGKRLLVVQAPAGYGKTVLLTQWRRHVLETGAWVAWLSCEKTDRSADRLGASIVTALIEAGGMNPAPRRNLALDDLLAQACQTTQETWLILDDWHLVQSTETADVIETLLRHMPGHWHLAISSRTRPLLNAIAWRARGQLIEIGKDDLRFSHGETAALLPAAAVTTLEEITEGWPIALQLAQLWLRDGGALMALRTSFIGAIDGMTDYIAAEIFADLPAELREFLLESSICARFSAELIDAIRQRDDAAVHLDTLKGLQGLVIALDEHRQWFRLHRIFGEYLDAERRKLSAHRLRQLHSCAADWFERQGLLLDAVHHAKLSGDEARTVELVENAGCVDICIRAGASAVRSLLDNLSSDVVWQRPRLRAAHTAMNLKLGSIAEAERALADLRSSVASEHMDAALERDLLVVENLRLCFIDKNPTLEDLAVHRTRIEALTGADWWLEGLMYNVQGRLEMRAGQLNEAVLSLTRAYQIFDAGGSSHGQFFMNVNLAICYLFLGRLSEAEDCIGQARIVLERQLDCATAYAPIAHVADALLLYERNELPAAGAAAQSALKGLELAEGCFEQYLISAHVAATVAFATTGIEAAARVIERGRRLASFHGLSRLNELLDCMSARLFIDADQWDQATSLVTVFSDSHPSFADIGWIELDFATPVLFQFELAAARIESAKDLAERMVRRSRASGRVPSEIRANLLLALAADAHDDQPGLRAVLRRALELAAPESIVQPFFECGDRLLKLLRDFQRSDLITLQSSQGNFLSGLILRMIATGKAKDSKEQLTPREREILEHLTQGSANKVIARALDLKENAVKFHLKNIFRKLGVENRAMAAAVAERMVLAGTLKGRAPGTKSY